MRLVYPVGNWKVDGIAVPGHVVIGLRTPDGFEVSFSLPAFELMRTSSQAAAAIGDGDSIPSN